MNKQSNVRPPRCGPFCTSVFAILAFGSAVVSTIWAPTARGASSVVELDETAIFFEENATDGDLGIQFFLDGDAWDRIMLFDPSWRRLVDIEVKGSIGEIGLTEVFSESEEPSFDDLPRDEFIELFPEGEYKFFGRTKEGDWLFGLAELTHTMPAQPVIVSPEEDEVVNAAAPLVVEWETVADPDAPDSVIVAYHVVVEKDVEDERLRVIEADMLPGDTEWTIAPGFLEPGKPYKFEIIAEETSGNKTISEVVFETAP